MDETIEEKTYRLVKAAADYSSVTFEESLNSKAFQRCCRLLEAIIAEWREACAILCREVRNNSTRLNEHVLAGGAEMCRVLINERGQK